MTGLQFTDVPIWAPLLAAVLLPAPLVLRRFHPVPVSVVQIVIYIVAGETGALELYASQVSLFMGIYSIGAWDPNRRRAHWARVIIVIAMAAWLASSAVRGFFDPETGERGVSAFFAFLIIQIVINAAYFGAGWIFGDRAWRSAIEQEELASAHAEIQAQQAQLAEQAVSLERMRIARELHDAVAHNVSVIAIQAAGADGVLDKDPARAAECATLIRTVAREALTELGRLVDTSQAPEPGLRKVADLAQRARDGGLPVDLTIEGDERDLPAGVDLAAFRIVQEALANTSKHAGQARASITVRYTPRELDIQIDDDGRGRTAPRTRNGTGHGLVGMRERVALYGGTFDAGPRDEGGFQVHARLPIGR
jgi:signal transduction histidine kinase